MYHRVIGGVHGRVVYEKAQKGDDIYSGSLAFHKKMRGHSRWEGIEQFEQRLIAEQ